MSFLLLRVDHFLCLPLASVTDVPHQLVAGSQKLKCLAGTRQDTANPNVDFGTRIGSRLYPRPTGRLEAKTFQEEGRGHK